MSGTHLLLNRTTFFGNASIYLLNLFTEFSSLNNFSSYKALNLSSSNARKQRGNNTLWRYLFSVMSLGFFRSLASGLCKYLKFQLGFSFQSDLTLRHWNISKIQTPSELKDSRIDRQHMDMNFSVRFYDNFV